MGGTARIPPNAVNPVGATCCGSFAGETGEAQWRIWFDQPGKASVSVRVDPRGVIDDLKKIILAEAELRQARSDFQLLTTAGEDLNETTKVSAALTDGCHVKQKL